ncbi:hypothetical protein JJB09_00245 [Rhizobium sp. KVB221]|uniref:Uncharacterized protein n=1 Tax=Rhizobium setariae TaxID=2801340 RepID=A0A937CKG5_9HYPH|nr:hypothetical protein [Rhizobium setariae]MBL0370446.1 hypothetical protein [Rhizobium setariae]
MKTRTRVTIVISTALNALSFAAGIVLVYALAGLVDRAELILPVVMLASLVMTPIIVSWLIWHFYEREHIGTHRHRY